MAFRPVPAKVGTGSADKTQYFTMAKETWKKGFYLAQDGSQHLAVWSEVIGDPVCLISSVETATEEDEKHADLIVAASEILEALRQIGMLAEWANNGGKMAISMQDILVIARDAIAKATTPAPEGAK